MATQNIFDLTDTWNNVATTFTAIKMNVTDTASAAGSLLIDLKVGGSSKFNVDKNGQVTAGNNIVCGVGASIGLGTGAAGWWSSGVGLRLPAIDILGWVSGTNAQAAADTILARDAADTLALRRSTNAQAFRVYNTFTDASNYERAKIAWDTNVLKIGTEKAGTGSARALELQTDGTTRLTIATTGVATFAGSLSIQATGYFQFGTGRAVLRSPADGILTLLNAAETDFNRLQFGGTTSSFPALKRSSTTLQARLADDSAFAPVQGKLTTDTAYTAGAPTATGYLVLYDSNGTAYKVPAEAL